MNRATRAALVVAIAFPLAFLVMSIRTIDGERLFTLFDDAMISMRYARNLADGYGLVWNPGEAAVEGYTNFLWTLLLAGVHLLRLSDSGTALAVSLLGATCLAALALSTARLARAALPSSEFLPAASVLLVGLFYPMTFWTIRGMEVGLLAFLLTEGMRTVLLLPDMAPAKARRRLAVLGGAAILTRPDAIVPCAILFGAAFAGARGDARRRVVLPALGFVFAAGAAHVALRWAVYGELVPNTATLKMTGRPALERAAQGAAAFAAVVRTQLAPLFALVAAGLLASRRLRAARATQLALVLFGGQVFYSIAVGGDSWEWMDFANRFLCVALPGVFVVAAASIEMLAGLLARGAPRTSKMFAGCGLALLLVALNGSSVAIGVREGAFHVSDDARMVMYGRALRECTREDARIAVVWAGTVPYVARRTCVDLLGKNDPVIARGPVTGRYQPGHDKWNAAHSLGALRPDVVAQTSLVWQEPGFWDIARRAGYERLSNGILVLRDSPRVDRAGLEKLVVPAW